MSRYTWVLDFGHGGIDELGIYHTPGKQYHFIQEDISIYEGDINRKIGHKLVKLLYNKGISYHVLTPGTMDIPLSKRVKDANALYAKNKNSIYVSLHSNAVSSELKGYGSNATGYEIFTSPGKTKSDEVAEVFLKTYLKELPDFKSRLDTSDGDLDKEAKFYVLTKTNCPAILIENLFYDNIKEAKYLLSSKGQDKLANVLFKAILNYESQV